MTPKEIQVLTHAADGKINQKIAFLLSISEKTVEKHMEGIFRKLNVSSRTEAAVWFTREAIQQTKNNYFVEN